MCPCSLNPRCCCFTFVMQQESLLVDCKSALEQQRDASVMAGRLTVELRTKIFDQEAKLEEAAKDILALNKGNLDLKAQYAKSIMKANCYITKLERDNEELQLKLTAANENGKITQPVKPLQSRRSMFVPPNDIASPSATAFKEIRGISTSAPGAMSTPSTSLMPCASGSHKGSRVSLRTMSINAIPSSSSSIVHVRDAKEEQRGKLDSANIRNATIATSAKSSQISSSGVSGVCRGGGPLRSVGIHGNVNDKDNDLLRDTTGVHLDSKTGPCSTAPLSIARNSGEMDDGAVKHMTFKDKCDDETELGDDRTTVPAPAPTERSTDGSHRNTSTSGRRGRGETGAGGASASRRVVPARTVKGARVNSSSTIKTAALTTRYSI